MKLTLLTRHSDADDEMSVSGETLTVNGTDYDLSSVPEGGEATASEGPFIGPIRRTSGQIEATVIYRFDTATALPIQPSEPPVVEIGSGPVPDPVTRRTA